MTYMKRYDVFKKSDQLMCQITDRKAIYNSHEYR